MRYFLSLPLPKALLSVGIGQVAATAGAVLFLGSGKTCGTCQRRTTGRTITLAAITAPAHHHLTMTTITVEQTRTD
jgi:hypothetical protein